MTDKRVIAVIGATGAQGGGLVRAIQKAGEDFVARAITRDPNSDKAKALAELGAEVVAGNIDEVASLTQAFEGAHGAFCVTFFWDHFSVEKEVSQAKNMAEAAKAAGVKHVIWSTFEDTRKLVPLDDDRMPTLQQKYKVPHLDGKGESNKFFTQAEVPTTFLYTSFYWDNFINFGMEPKRGEDGKLAIVFPMGDKKLPGIWKEDIGKCAYGIFAAGDEYIGRTVGVAGEHLTGTQMAASLTRALGEEVGYTAVSADVYRGFGFPGADEVGNMFQYKRDFNEEYCGARDLILSLKLNPELSTFDSWLEDNARNIPLEALTNG